MTLRDSINFSSPLPVPVIVFEDRPMHYAILEYFNTTLAKGDLKEYNFKDSMHKDPYASITIPEKYMDRGFCYIGKGDLRAFITMSSSDARMYLRYVLRKFAGTEDSFYWKPPVQED